MKHYILQRFDFYHHCHQIHIAEAYGAVTKHTTRHPEDFSLPHKLLFWEQELRKLPFRPPPYHYLDQRRQLLG